MRYLLNIMMGAMLIATVCFVVMFRHGNTVQEKRCEQVKGALKELREQMLYHTSLGEAMVTESGFPDYVEAGWFRRGLPFNQMVGNGRPWIDVAPKGDYRSEPPDPVIVSDAQAGIWYNPNRGIFRARVKHQVSESATLAMYNEVNGLKLKRLPRDLNEKRQPMVMRVPSHAAAYASVGGSDEPHVRPQVREEVKEVVVVEVKKRSRLEDLKSN